MAHRYADHVLEIFVYEGYNIETLIYDNGSLRLSAFLKGKCCLKGTFSPTGVGYWSHDIQTDHAPDYKVREYLKHYALKRAKE